MEQVQRDYLALTSKSRKLHGCLAHAHGLSFYLSPDLQGPESENVIPRMYSMTQIFEINLEFGKR